jgi:four helix bundle protein
MPKTEQFNLSSQIRRAVTSISLNIAEGSTGQSDPEQVRFIRYAHQSLMEVVACLILMKERLYYSR